jgi:8-oxo-dGTP diphosphatase
MQTIEVSAVILFDGPLMLVSRRPEGTFFGGWWEWPGGKRELGESPEECARRELIEEIGIKAGALTVFAREVAEYPGRKVSMTFFVGNKLPGESPSAAALEHRWMRPNDVRQLKFLEPNLPVLQRLIDNPPPSPDSARFA